MFYKIVGLCPSLDGLVVESCEGPLRGREPWCMISRILNTNKIFGDRCTSEDTHSSLKIYHENLEAIDDPTDREFASDNPYGKFVYEGSFSGGGLTVSFSRYENALQVSVLEKASVIYTQNFKTSSAEGVMSLLREMVYTEGNGEDTLDDMIFELEDIKNNEA